MQMLLQKTRKIQLVTNEADKEKESNVVSTTIPNIPPLRNSVNRGKRADDEMEQGTKCPPRRMSRISGTELP